MINAPTLIKLAQHNLKKRPLAMYEFRNTAVEYQVDVVAMQEPPTLRGKVAGTEQGDRVVSCPGDRRENAPESAILVLNKDILVTARQDLSNQFIAVANIDAPGVNFDLISVYAKFSLRLCDILIHLQQALDRLSQKVLVLGDFNAHSVLWGDRRTDNKGLMLEEFAARNGLTILNDPHSPPTFSGTGGVSHIDVSMGSFHVAQAVESWAVVDWTCSDHKVITLNIRAREAVLRKEETLRH